MRELKTLKKGKECPGQKIFFSRKPPKTYLFFCTRSVAGNLGQKREASITRSEGAFECTFEPVVKFIPAKSDSAGCEIVT